MKVLIEALQLAVLVACAVHLLFLRFYFFVVVVIAESEISLLSQPKKKSIDGWEIESHVSVFNYF